MDAPLIVHADVDAFFASVEQVLNPGLQGKPVVVGGGIGGRGVIASCSYEARPFGLKAGMPIFRARELCPDGLFVPPNFAEYNRFAARVFDILSSVSPSVEQASLDDAYVDLSGCERMYGVWSARPLSRLPFAREGEGIYRRSDGVPIAPESRIVLPDSCRWVAGLALSVKRRIRRETGLDVSFGIGSNKLIARVASDLGKPNGIGLVECGREADFMSRLELKDIPGLGRSTRSHLLKWNVRTVAEARHLPRELLCEAFGTERGPLLYDILRGRIDDRHGELRIEELPRSISRETTFWTPSSDRGFVESMLFYLTERLGRALRRDGLEGRTVQVKLRYQDFARVQCSRSLGESTDRDDLVFETARRLLRARWCRTRRLRLVGVGLTDLGPARSHQTRLFDTRGDRCRRIDRCLDGLRERFGFGVIQRGPAIELMHAAEAGKDPVVPAPARP